jgi:hypothetical protein
MLPLLLALLATPAAGEPSALARDPRGWVDIMPGPGLAGWTRVAPISTRKVIAVVHQDLDLWTPNRPRGVLDCRAHLPATDADGKVGSHEMLRHDKEVGDFIFHVEWRFLDSGREGWNAGIYARVNGITIWHQAQVGAEGAGYWFGDSPDAAGKIVRTQLAASQKRVKPAGQWNSYEITGRGDTLTLWVNGAEVSQWRGLRVLRGHVGLEAERHHIQFRNLKLKELPAATPAAGGAAAPPVRR